MLSPATTAYDTYEGVITQPDIPRTLTVTASAASASGRLTIHGIDWKGQYVTEAITLAGGEETVIGNVAFMKVLRFSGYNAGGAETISVGTGTKVGMPKKMISDDLVSPVMKFTINNDDVAIPATAFAPNTVEFSPVSGTDDYTVWYLH